MRKLEDLMSGHADVFGPGTDLVVSMAAVLILVLAIQTSLHQKELENLRVESEANVDLRVVEENQRRFVEEVAAQFPNSVTVSLDPDVIRLDIGADGSWDIVFHSQATRQRVTFGGHILFDPDGIELNENGRSVVTHFGRALIVHLDAIQEIHIEGHADITPTRYGSNLELGALRAISVFSELQALGISPYATVMSATSFGEFMSVQRFKAGLLRSRGYTEEQVWRDNETDEQKQLNRRMEVELVYAR